MSPRLVELSSLGAADVEAVRAIYEGAFPDELLAPFEDLLVDRMLVYLAGKDGEDGEDGRGVPVGLALVRDLVDAVPAGRGDTGWTFLRYFAAGRRGQGIGSALWAELTGRLRAEGRTRLVWDVEDPDEPDLPSELVEEHRRRIVFYERLGGRLQPVRDYLPPHDDGHAPRLLLMDQPLTPPADGQEEVGLRELVETVYALRYGVPADDPVVRRTLAASGLV
ncbi:GNAT family N-acetyltransferase [Nocardioides sp. Leaf307]|uniref:GNAT family N-acetyltransferase n=1 Tax=Nocardioides sp. Leaf307 TaxID=1736331 RepID=UPI00138F15C4|nr:GNAT family N-acetyltransferase [Nocardioides sp. Leaf307]